jgi:predicted GIY-YIG superfamily endonuclease
LKKTWRLYILKCSDNTLYTGITNDLPRRLVQHNSGTASRYTRSRLPVSLVHQEQCQGRSNALKKEYRMKSLSRKEKVEYIREKGGTLDNKRSWRGKSRRSGVSS